MPAHRKPPETLQDRRPSRLRGPAPEVREPLGNAPEGFGEAETLAWQEISAGAPEGVLTRADRLAVELAASLVAEYRRAPADFKTSRLAVLQSLLRQFGMVPQGRLALSLPLAPKAAEVNPFSTIRAWSNFPDSPRRR